MSSKYSLGISVFSVLLMCGAAHAEFLCHTSVAYVWGKTQEESEQEVFWARIERKGVDEATAKRTLEEALATERVKALDQCRQDHENLADCVAGKFSSLAPTLQRLSFSQRKSIEDAVNSDCHSRQGRCGTVKVDEVKCAELVTAASSSSAGGKDAGKDAKKKK
jgi:hypothetical protein